MERTVVNLRNVRRVLIMSCMLFVLAALNGVFVLIVTGVSPVVSSAVAQQDGQTAEYVVQQEGEGGERGGGRILFVIQHPRDKTFHWVSCQSTALMQIQRGTLIKVKGEQATGDAPITLALTNFVLLERLWTLAGCKELIPRQERVTLCNGQVFTDYWETEFVRD